MAFADLLVIGTLVAPAYFLRGPNKPIYCPDLYDPQQKLHWPAFMYQ